MENDILYVDGINAGEKKGGIMLMIDFTEATTKNGNPYCKMRLSDGKRTINANKFDTSKSDLSIMGIGNDTPVHVELECGTFNNSLNYKVLDLYLSQDSSISKEDFANKIEENPEALFEEIISILRQNISKGPSDILNLAIDILTAHHDQFIQSSAAIAIHHSLIGGLLLHTYQVLKGALAMCSVFPHLDSSLLLSGCAIHDIGKIYEYNTSDMGTTTITPYGRSIGHPGIGLLMLNEAAMTGQYNSEDVLLLNNMIASHHGLLEYGALVPPAIPESSILHHLDAISAEMDQYYNAYDEMNPGEVSSKIYGLGSSVYKPHSNIA